MSTPDSASNGPVRLKRFLKSAGWRSFRLDRARYMVNFISRTREWSVVTTLGPDWFNVQTLVCELPKEPGIRARLMEWAMKTNRGISVAKFGASGSALVLEIDYRAEHIDEHAFANLVGLLLNVADDQYMRIVRIVSGDDVLESLERSLDGGPNS